MAFTPAKDAELIGGYRLVEKLGAGGSGEVWKATAPGSGTAVGMGYAVRQVLEGLGLPAGELCGMLLYATGTRPADQEMARVNASATLCELDHFSGEGAEYPGDPEHGLAPFAAGQAPFEEAYLVHLGDQLDRNGAEAATDALAEYLFLNACPGGGTFLDRFRAQSDAPPPGPGEPVLLRTFGLSRIGQQGEHPLDLATHLLCRRLTEKWSAGPGDAEGVLLCYEAAGCPLREATRSLLGPVEVPPDLVRRVMTRVDVSWTVPEPTTV
jgi:hypothetical protein